MVLTKNHGIDSDLWYSIGTPESHTYKRAECCPFAGFLVEVSTDVLILVEVLAEGLVLLVVLGLVEVLL